MGKVNINKISDFVFVLAVFLLPFENLFFAPSEGWATITPVVLFFYLLLNFNLVIKMIVKYRKIIYFISFTFLTSIFGYCTNLFYFQSVVSSCISLFFGFVTLFSLDIYFIQKKKDVNCLVNVVLAAYSISAFVGILQHATIKLDLDGLKNVFDLVEKRSYIGQGRVQFTFTEPSFVGMHMFGILLPLFMKSRNKKILLLIVIFSILSLMICDSVRFLLDIAVVLACILVFFVLKHFNLVKSLITMGSLLIILIVGSIVVYSNSYRVQKIVTDGVYADGSLASRFFRIESSIHGYKNKPLYFVVGYGYGNASEAIKDGYDSAIKKYDNDRDISAISSPDYHDDAAAICLYIRMISEIGFISTTFIFMFLLYKSYKSKNLLFLFIVLYLYVQFDSYAFYSMWILLLACWNSKILMKSNLEREDCVLYEG